MAQNSAAACSKLSLKGPAGITQPGDSVAFNVASTGSKHPANLSFEWKVEGYTFFEGQGTSQISVPATRDVGNVSVTAFVKINDQKSGCSIFLSESAGIGPTMPGPDHYWFVFGSQRDRYVRSHMDLFFSKMANNPNVEGLIELTFPQDTTRQRKVSRLKLIDKHLAYRRFSPERISYYLRTGEHERIRTIRMSPGADYGYFGIDRSKLIKAEEYKPTKIF
jgi:hypothetical protein